MKTLEFETSKGRFVVKDLNFIPLDCNGIKLSEITEEQASEIVDLFNILPYHYQDYERDACAYNTAIESLHSLLKSKGVHLFKNPFKNTYSIQSLKGSLKHRNQIIEAEQKTFYNPFIYKL